MDRQAFKQRMQNLKSYRENNPGKGYWDWRNSLPDNLKYTDDTEYDMQAAYESGVDAEYVEEDRSYHLPTRDPKTGYIFKKSIHPTFWKGLAEDAKLGYDAYFLGDKVYTKSKGEGPIEAFVDGGEIGDPEKERFYQATGRSSSGRPLEEGLKPVFSLEDAANMTPIGDAISAKDAYDAVKNKDWLGAGLAASAMIPFIPNVYRSLKSKISREVPTVTRSFQRQVDANDLRRDLENNNRRRVLEEYSDQRNRTYELLNTPEARRRAQIIDRKYGTEYNKVYDDLTKEYEDINSYVNLPEPNFVSNKKDYANIDPSKSKIINLSTNNIRTAEDYPKGLIRHEIGHYVDEKAYPGGVPNNAYLRQLGKPSKYRSFSEVEHMYRVIKTEGYT